MLLDPQALHSNVNEAIQGLTHAVGGKESQQQLQQQHRATLSRASDQFWKILEVQAVVVGVLTWFKPKNFPASFGSASPAPRSAKEFVRRIATCGQTLKGVYRGYI